MLVMGEVKRSGDRGVLRLSLADYPVLNEPFGSLRLSTSAMNPNGERPLGFFPAVIINRGGAGELYVMSAECSHEGCTVRKLDPVNKKLVCPCHGSVYDIDGRSISGPEGGPPIFPLREYAFEQKDGVLNIFLPDEVFYELTWTPVANSAEARMKLNFLTFSNYRYEVYFRSSLEGASTRMSFSRTADGPLTEQLLEGTDDFETIYLPRPTQRGFYQVAMQFQSV